MKVSVDIDCTPEELRTFFGLPDVQPGMQNWEQLQKAFWSQFNAAGNTTGKNTKD